MGVEVSDKQKLYIRLPVRIEDELEVKDLHPNIIRVYLPRQKSRRWCIVEFENKEKQREAIIALKKLKINNKSIKISSYKTKSKSDKPKKRLVQSTQPLLKLLKKKT